MHGQKDPPGDAVHLIGYPAAAEFPDSSDASALEPTINDGTISARKTSVDGTPLLQTSAAAAHGSSGGPALNDDAAVIGLLTIGDPDTQGFHFLVPSNTALEFVRQAGAQNTPSLVDPIWRQALDHFWRGEYRSARDNLQEVIALFPAHAEALALARVCQERISTGQDRSGWRGFLGPVHVGGAAVLVVVVAVIALAFRHRRTPAISRAAVAPGPAEAAPGERSATEVYDEQARPGRLLHLTGAPSGQPIEIGGGIFIGRETGRSQFVVDDPQVSGQHAWVGTVGGRVTLRDCDSTNGTFLNDDLSRRIKEVELKDGDTFTLGGRGTVKFQYKS